MSPRDQIRRQINSPDEQFVGPYEKNGENAFAIETLAWAAGLAFSAEGCVYEKEAENGQGT